MFRRFFLPFSLVLLVSGSLTASESLFGRVLCGYQGWFNTPGDGANLGWRHYGFEKPDQCHLDLWPDLTGFGEDELHDTPLRFADGSVAQVFSSANANTTLRHFEWMREHGIDGVMLQRFGTTLRDPRLRAHNDEVLANVRAAAEATGRSFCVMYDLSGLKAGEIDSIVVQDWKRLHRILGVLESPAYQFHAGRPVVSVWGIGFDDGRDYTVAECAELMRFLRDNPEFGQLTTMAGVPWGWRTLDQDAVADPALHEALERVQIVSPWAVGRYDETGAKARIASVHEADTAWCRERGKEYLPVIFPGFSWANLQKMRGEEAKLNQIPRNGGTFFWGQAQERIRLGATMLYVAMFDEMDEATAIFKHATEVPEGTLGFVNETGLPSDHYLWLTGEIGRALRRERSPTEALPTRP
jgi:hypothetical protein